MFEDLKKRKQKQEEEREQLKKEVEKLTAEAAALDIRMEKAKADGAAEEYFRLQALKTEALTSAEFKEIQSGFEDKIPLEDYLKAWEDYSSKEYAKKYNTALNRMEDAKQAFLKSFRDLMVVQNEAVARRHELAWIMGNLRLNFTDIMYHGELVGSMYQVFPVYKIDQKKALEFYMQHNKGSKADQVVEGRLPVKDPSEI